MKSIIGLLAVLSSFSYAAPPVDETDWVIYPGKFLIATNELTDEYVGKVLQPYRDSPHHFLEYPVNGEVGYILFNVNSGRAEIASSPFYYFDSDCDFAYGTYYNKNITDDFGPYIFRAPTAYNAEYNFYELDESSPSDIVYNYYTDSGDFGCTGPAEVARGLIFYPVIDIIPYDGDEKYYGTYVDEVPEDPGQGIY